MRPSRMRAAYGAVALRPTLMQEPWERGAAACANCLPVMTQPFFAFNELAFYMNKAGVMPPQLSGQPMSRRGWLRAKKVVCRKWGRPRRLSAAFLHQQRICLHTYRDTARSFFAQKAAQGGGARRPHPPPSKCPN